MGGSIPKVSVFVVVSCVRGSSNGSLSFRDTWIKIGFVSKFWHEKWMGYVLR